MTATADAVLLIAFGGPTRSEEIRPFLANVVRGREHRIPAERIEEVVHHYEMIGGRSPLNEITLRQAARLETALATDGPPLPVFVGMRNWAPYLADTLARMAETGVQRAIGVILAPHAVEASRERYIETIDAARTALGTRAPAIRYVAPWYAHPLFITAVADAVVAALVTLPATRRAGAPLVFTAHSVPVAMASRSPYVEQLTVSARAVAERLGRARWQVAFQSRSGSPHEPWLEPDVKGALRALAAGGAEDAVVVPVGFVCDHVEVLYDLDVEARATARELGLGFVRASTVNDHPLFIRMLAELVRTAVAEG
ncbi:MAG: ferrochelatase [Deltaproteobacteria bacterium]|nr:MAG: ferrochelatase [Deltaproteobacteria bacterium]